MQCHSKDDGYVTIEQWHKKGYTIKDDIEPTIMWNNRFCRYTTEFCKEDEIREMTADELNVYREKVQAANKRRYEKVKREREHAKLKMERIESQYGHIFEYDHVPAEKMVVFDVETTGLNLPHEILQFSACDGNGNMIMNKYFKPRFLTEWPEAESINHISPEMVKDKPYIFDFIDDIQKIIDEAELLITYNGTFDKMFLKMYGIDFKDKPEVDVMKEFARRYGEWNEYYCDYKWQKLTMAAGCYGFDWKKYSAHDSSSDVLATLFVFNKIREEHKNENSNN